MSNQICRSIRRGDLLGNKAASKSTFKLLNSSKRQTFSAAVNIAEWLDARFLLWSKSVQEKQWPQSCSRKPAQWINLDTWLFWFICTIVKVYFGKIRPRWKTPTEILCQCPDWSESRYRRDLHINNIVDDHLNLSYQNILELSHDWMHYEPFHWMMTHVRTKDELIWI